MFTCNAETGCVDEHVYIDAAAGEVLPETPDCSGDVKYVMPICNGCNDYDWGSMMATWDSAQCGMTWAPVDTTEPVMEYVSMEEYNALLDRVVAMESSYAMLEMSVNDIDNGVETIASCAAGYLEGRDTEATDMPVTTEDSDSVTGMPYETSDNSVYVATGTKCPYSQPGTGSRTFKLKFTTLENCANRCEMDGNCNYISVDGNDCIGCIDEPSEMHEGFVSYMTMEYYMSMEDSAEDDDVGTRRQLSEIDFLRAENAQLRAALKRRL